MIAKAAVKKIIIIKPVRSALLLYSPISGEILKTQIQQTVKLKKKILQYLYYCNRAKWPQKQWTHLVKTFMGSGSILQPTTATTDWKKKKRHFWEKIAEFSMLLLILNILKPSYILPEQFNELSVSHLTHCAQRCSAVQG